jgi:hypothetical protein
MRGRQLAVVAVMTLALWVLSGPIAMAFDGCAMMGAMCEAPCGASSYIVSPTVTGVAGLEPISYLDSRSTPSPTAFTPGPLTPPPKPSLVSP